MASHYAQLETKIGNNSYPSPCSPHREAIKVSCPRTVSVRSGSSSKACSAASRVEKLRHQFSASTVRRVISSARSCSVGVRLNRSKTASRMLNGSRFGLTRPQNISYWAGVSAPTTSVRKSTGIGNGSALSGSSSGSYAHDIVDHSTGESSKRTLISTRPLR